MGISIKIEVSGSHGRILNKDLPTDLVDLLSISCSYEPEGSKFMSENFNAKNSKSKFRKHWDGRIRMYNKQTRKFPRGLMQRVVAIITHKGHKVEFASNLVQPRSISYPLPSEEWALRPYQLEVLASLILNPSGMVKVATGGGKTVIAGHSIVARQTPALFFVHTKDLLYQAKDTFESMFGAKMVGQIGDGVVEPCADGVTICTIQTAARIMDIKYERDTNAEGDESWDDKETKYESKLQECVDCLMGAGYVMMDECHRVAAPTAVNLLNSLTDAMYRTGFSASPWRDDGCDIALEGVFGHVIANINATQLIDIGFLVPPIIRMVDVPAMRFEKGTKYTTIYEEYVVKNEVRNGLGVDAAIRKIERGIQTMILVRQISHGLEVQRMLREKGVYLPFLSGRDDSDLRRHTINELRNRRLSGLIATTIADEGLDIKPLGGLVLLGGGKSSTRALQRIGRVLRPFEGKKSADVTDFNDNAKFLVDHTAKRIKIYDSEPSFTVIDS